MRRKAIVAALSLLLLTAGCVSTPAWSVGPEGNVAEVNETYRYSGNATFSGVGVVTLYDVHVVVLDEEQSRLASIAVGRLTDSRDRVAFTVTTEELPTYVLMKVRRVDEPE